ncbi:MAG: lipopolysaccharide biosynthesis protein RfbH [Alphaproteobacteria bacterium]|uniref:lipopolysaccharide biosynthesis protein RfbH n=2 Tax=Alphaproteobacteria TaxID=28211 RepID=UPI0032797021
MIETIREMALSREHILQACAQYHAGLEEEAFVPGATYVPVSGKVLNADDLVHLVDASLDMWLTAGRFSDKFSEALAAFFPLKYVNLTVSGSAANLLAFSSLTSPKLGDRRIEKGAEVITVAAGFPTTVTPIIQNGCIPVFVDADPRTGNVDASLIEAAVTPRTRAIMLAHALGNPFDLETVMAVAEKHDLYVIEDCCDALGATFKGRHVGTFGDLATLSFYPAHHITTGEGGAVLSRHKHISKQVESFRDWGRDCWCAPGMDNTCNKRFKWQLGDLPPGYDHKYTYSHIGYNMKLTDMQAAIGVSQLKKAPSFIDARRRNFAAYTDAFRNSCVEDHLILPEFLPDADPSWFGYLMTVRDGSPLKRVDILTRLEQRRIGTRLLFAGNLTKQPAFASVEYRISSPLTGTDKIMNDSFWIGVWPGIQDAQRTYVIETLFDVIKELLD